MKRHAITQRLGTALAAVALATGCATAPPPPAPRIERLSAAVAEAKLPEPAAAISVDEVIALTQRGETAAAIIAKIDASHSRYRLDAGRIAQLVKQGVALEVIDHMLEIERRRTFDDMATEMARHDQSCRERVERMEQELRQCRLQASTQYWPHQPFANCWPPHPGFPYWRCF